MLQPVEFLGRIYSDGQHTASMFVLLGPTGPTAVHTPDICFDSQSYRALGDRRTISLARPSGGGPSSKFWQRDFESRDLDGSSVRTWYAWSDGGPWVASDDPRYEFAGNRLLFKIQVALSFPDGATMESDTVGPDFLLQLDAVLREHVFRP